MTKYRAAAGIVKGSGKAVLYRVTMELPERELKKLTNYERVIPLFRDVINKNDCIFIRENFVNGIGCEQFYDEYCDRFSEESVLKKRVFYAYVRKICDAENTTKRNIDGETQTIFVKNC